MRLNYYQIYWIELVNKISMNIESLERDNCDGWEVPKKLRMKLM